MEKIELKVHKPKQPRMTSIEESIQIARIQQAATTSALYERKHNQKALKVLTVAAYILFVSMAAITLSFYYVFIWDPSSKTIPPRSSNNCDNNKVVIPESLAVRLANSTEVTAENFINIFRSYQTHKKEEKMVVVKQLNGPPPPLYSVITSTTSTTTTSTSNLSTPPLQPADSPPDSRKLQLDEDEDAENDGDYDASGGRASGNDTVFLIDEDTNRNRNL